MTCLYYAGLQDSQAGNRKNSKPFSLLLIISEIFGLGSFNFVLLKSSEMGIGESTIPLVYAVINVSHTAIGIPAGILADKIGKEKVLILGFVLFVLSAALMVLLTGNSSFAFVLAAVFGLYLGISETVQRAIVPKYVPSELRGTAFGIYNLILGASFFVSLWFFVGQPQLEYCCHIQHGFSINSNSYDVRLYYESLFR